MEKPETRMPFLDQPCQTVIVDTLSPSAHVVQTFSKSLLRSVTLSSSIRGACRVPAVCVVALGRMPALCCPLQDQKGKLHQLASTLHQLNERARLELNDGRTADDVGRVELAIDIATKQLDEFCSKPGQASSQLQLTVLTADHDVISKLRLWSRTAADASRLQRVQIFRVVKFGAAAGEDATADVDCDGDVAAVPLDVTDTHGDGDSFDRYFQSWLLEQSTSSIHVRLHMPPLEAPLSLSCDMQAALVSPLSLPFTHRLLLTPEKTAWHAAAKGEVMVHQLEVTGRVPRTGVCLSHVHGEPVVLKPTACWQLDWEQLVINRQRVRALSSELKSSDEVLLAKLADGRSRPNVVGRFMLLPAFASEGDSLLVCALTPAELVLPSGGKNTDQSFLPLPPEVAEEMRQRLAGIPRHPNYNPLDHPSGLSEALAALSHKPQSQSTAQESARGGTSCSRGNRGRARGSAATAAPAAGPSGDVPSGTGGPGRGRAPARGTRGSGRGRPLFWKDDWTDFMDA